MTMHTKELTKQETEVVQDLESELDELQAQLETYRAEASSLDSRRREIQQRLSEIKSPFSVGDIVVDEEDVKYRVTHVTSSRPKGIRLSANGAEAHKDPRTIWSNKLELSA